MKPKVHEHLIKKMIGVSNSLSLKIISLSLAMISFSSFNLSAQGEKEEAEEKQSDEELNEFCQSYTRILAQSAYNFEDITSDFRKDNLYECTVPFPGATDIHVMRTSYDTTFEATFGEYKTQEEALSYVTEMQNTLRACYDSVRFTQGEMWFTHTPYFKITRITPEGFNIMPGHMGVQKNENDKYEPFVYMPGGEPALAFNSLLNDADHSSLFSEELMSVMFSAKNNFEDLKTDKIDVGFSLVTYYNSNFCISKTHGCVIEDELTGRKFECYLAKNIDKQAAIDAVNKTAGGLSTVLGKEYSYAENEDASGYYFTLNDGAAMHHDMIELKMQNGENNTFHVVLMVKAMTN